MSDIEARAQAIATLAHKGQLDKAGEPYIGHPARVAKTFGSSRDVTAGEVAAAWLHDVLEDTEVTEEDLKAAGIPYSTINCVIALTKVKGESNDAYYQRILDSGQAAIQIKLADIADNTDIRRLAKLDDETIVRLVRKYAHAIEVLS